MKAQVFVEMFRFEEKDRREKGDEPRDTEIYFGLDCSWSLAITQLNSGIFSSNGWLCSECLSSPDLLRTYLLRYAR